MGTLGSGPAFSRVELASRGSGTGGACPKGVDPARAIQLMKRQLVFDYLHLLRRREPAGLVPRPEGAKPPADAPKAPARTVGK